MFLNAEANLYPGDVDTFYISGG